MSWANGNYAVVGENALATGSSQHDVYCAQCSDGSAAEQEEQRAAAGNNDKWAGHIAVLTVRNGLSCSGETAAQETLLILQARFWLRNAFSMSV